MTTTPCRTQDDGSARPDEGRRRDTSTGEVGVTIQWVPIADLQPSYSPRSAGEDSQHLQAMAESESDLPPIIVQCGTNRVIDGMHRVRAAELRGDQEIRARFFSGDDESAFVLAVQLNVAHGLPLTLADRKDAARRILDAHDNWSDRAIASVAGLSHKTVASLRDESGRMGGSVRVGRDGHARPVNTACGRERARRILEKNPTASLRQVSSAAGVSPGTVRSVRDQLRTDQLEVERIGRGPHADDPVDAGESAPTPVPAETEAVDEPRNPLLPFRTRPRDLRSAAESDAVLRMLRADPSLRLTQSGRQLLSMLAIASLDPVAHERLVVALPVHTLNSVADLAASSVRAWRELEARVVRRQQIASQNSGDHPTP